MAVAIKTYNKEGMSSREVELIQQIAQLRKERNDELEYEELDGYELPPRSQFSMLKKPTVTIKCGSFKFNMACIRLFAGIKDVLTIVNSQKKRLAVIMCAEEESASVEWARKKEDKWVNKDITSQQVVEKIYRIMNWNQECRYKVLGRVVQSRKGLILMFELEEAIRYNATMEDVVDPKTGEVKKKRIPYFPERYSNRFGKSFTEYEETRQLEMFEDITGYTESDTTEVLIE